ncbi:uncharacterized protein LOC106874652 [Argonauta hians]
MTMSNGMLSTNDSHLKDCNDSSIDSASIASINLDKGNQLSEESKTDTEIMEQKTVAKEHESEKKTESFRRIFSISNKLKKKPTDSKDEEKVFQIPPTGNIIEFDVEQMCQFFACFNVSENLLNTLRKKKVNGERFSRITDDELNTMKLNNIVVCYFRNKCKKNNKHNFML